MKGTLKMNSSTSNSTNTSSSFHLLDPKIQRWIWESCWTELQDAQERAIPVILDRLDIVIAAPTATGKTEAAFLPILTNILKSSNTYPTVVYISPLKALINDQWARLDLLCEKLDVIVTPWHGDISPAKKKKFMSKPSGCVLITPESLESLFMNYGQMVGSIFSSLAYIVVDEVHSFMGTERGKQLQSLLHRLDMVIGRKVSRVGLSATIGDLNMAAAYLRPENPEQVTIVQSESAGQELRVLTLGYKIAKSETEQESETEEDDLASSCKWVANKLFSTLRGTNNLVFPNSRAAVEVYSDQLRKMCEDNGLPNEFWPHHGNLAKGLREETEHALKQKDKPASAICTNTLELGIDIGLVKSVAQVGPPPSVASLRQRLGRSGRKKGDPAILRAYCIENSLDQQSRLSDLLREQLVQTIAMIRLLIAGWCEPIGNNGLHLSTLIQQLLSVIAQYGGVTASTAWNILCETGPFKNLAKSEFRTLLLALGQKNIIIQDHTGLLLTGVAGEKIVNHYSFYAAFKSDEEFLIICQGKTLGSLPFCRALTIGSYLIFAGRRWRIIDVSEQKKAIIVLPDKGGRVPRFYGGGAKLHDKVREEMREVLRSNESILFLDKTGVSLLDEARYYYAKLDLDNQAFKKMGKDVNVFVWKGDNVQDTLALMATVEGLPAINEGLYISVEADSVAQVQAVFSDILQKPEMSADNLAACVKNKEQEKWDRLLLDSLLNRNYAALNIDVSNALQAIRCLLKNRTVK